MKIAQNAPKRPALRYYGGKWRLASWIISFFPPHQNYVEPCGGAASVLLQKPRSPLETYNDLDGNVVNFFRVLRDRPDELTQKIRLTPWARAEYESSLEPCEDEVERARRFFIAGWMSFNGAVTNNTRTHGWRNSTDFRLRPPAAYDIVNNCLEQITERLIGVQIEGRDYKEVIERLDNDAALIYLDPPYVSDTKTHDNWYSFEWPDCEHRTAATLLYQCQGYVVISGYACPLYTELYEAHGWQRFGKEARTNSGGKRIESVWLSPRTAEALNKPRQAKLELGI